MTEHISLFGIRVDVVTMAEAETMATEFVSLRQPHLIVTVNTEMVMVARQDPDLKRVVNNAALVVPDGAGIIWAARRLGRALPERVAGFDLVMRLLKLAPDRGYKLFFLGGAPGVAEAAAKAACRIFPGLQVVGTHHGYFAADQDEQVLKMIAASQADILLAALGVPKQEKWLWNNMGRLPVPLLMGVGGTFDVLAGAARRAPVWMQRAGLEWLYRLFREPWRARRMLVLPRFAWQVLLTKKD